MAERRIPDLEVRGSSLARRVVSLDKELLLHFSSLHPGAPIRSRMELCMRMRNAILLPSVGFVDG